MEPDETARAGELQGQELRADREVVRDSESSAEVGVQKGARRPVHAADSDDGVRDVRGKCQRVPCLRHGDPEGLRCLEGNRGIRMGGQDPTQADEDPQEARPQLRTHLSLRRLSKVFVGA